MLEALKAAPADAESFRKTVRWNLGAWLGQVHKPLRVINTGGPCDRVAFSPDGSSFATGFSPIDRAIAEPVKLWDTASGRKLSSLRGAFAPFSFRPDGKVLIAYTDAWRMAAIDLSTEKVLWTTSRLPGEWGENIDFSPDGSTVFASRHEKPGGTWLLQLDVATGQQRGEPIRGRGKLGVAPDGKSVTTFHIENGEAHIDVYGLPSGRLTFSWPAGKSHFGQLLFSPDGKSLFGAIVEGDAFNLNGFFGRIWDSATGRPTSPLMARTDSAAFAPSADRLLTKTDNVMLLRDALTGRVRGAGIPDDRLYQSEFCFAQHPGGRKILAVGREHTVRLWQIAMDAEPVADSATRKQTSATGQEVHLRTRGLHAFWSSLRGDGQVAVSLMEGLGRGNSSG